MITSCCIKSYDNYDKFEIRISKYETNISLNPKFEYLNPKQIRITEIQITQTTSFENLNIRILILFRISNFVLRAFHSFGFRASYFKTIKQIFAIH